MSEISAVTTTGAVLGAVLANLRSAADLKQSDLADAVGVGPSTWSRIEKGESGLSIDQLRLVARALGYTPGQILEMAEAAESEATEKGIQVQPLGTSIASIASIGVGATSIGAVIPVLGNVLGTFIGASIAGYVAGKKNRTE